MEKEIMHLFDQDLMLQQEGPLYFTGTISKNWMINGIANGGFIMSLMAKAMLKVSDKAYTSIMTATYISRCQPGSVELKLEEIARSSRFTRLQASLFQDGKEKVRAWGTFVTVGPESLPDRYESGPPELAALKECFEVPSGSIHSLLENLEMRLDPSCTGWLTGNLAERSEQKGWVSFRKERPYDALSLLTVADSFPPPIFASHGLIGWVPTIELSVNIRNLPASKWLKFSLRTRFLTAGLVEEDGEVWDEVGNLICISRQLAQTRISG